MESSFASTCDAESSGKISGSSNLPSLMSDLMSEGQDGRDRKEYAGPICGGDEGMSGSSGNGLPIDVAFLLRSRKGRT